LLVNYGLTVQQDKLRYITAHLGLLLQAMHTQLAILLSQAAAVAVGIEAVVAVLVVC
jgi:hypothetical protein